MLPVASTARYLDTWTLRLSPLNAKDTLSIALKRERLASLNSQVTLKLLVKDGFATSDNAGEKRRKRKRP